MNRAIYPSRWYRVKRFFKIYDQELILLAAFLALGFVLLKVLRGH